MSGEYNLNRFVNAQDKTHPTIQYSYYQISCNEIERGKKYEHWIWYIFPQYKGLGMSSISVFYAIKSKEEALSYLGHPLLGKRLIEMSEMLVSREESMLQIFGRDEKKVKSCMTLFEAIQSEIKVFNLVLEHCFGGKRCKRTLNYLR